MTRLIPAIWLALTLALLAWAMWDVAGRPELWRE